MMTDNKDTQATAGPWHVQEEIQGISTVYHVIHRSGFDNSGCPLLSRIATVFPNALCDEHAPASDWTARNNARLIAAAPETARERDELAGALRELLRLEAIKDDDDVELQITRENARAVLAKVGR